MSLAIVPYVPLRTLLGLQPIRSLGSGPTLLLSDDFLTTCFQRIDWRGQREIAQVDLRFRALIVEVDHLAIKRFATFLLTALGDRLSDLQKKVLTSISKEISLPLSAFTKVNLLKQSTRDSLRQIFYILKMVRGPNVLPRRVLGRTHFQDIIRGETIDLDEVFRYIDPFSVGGETACLLNLVLDCLSKNQMDFALELLSTSQSPVTDGNDISLAYGISIKLLECGHFDDAIKVAQKDSKGQVFKGIFLYLMGRPKCNVDQILGLAEALTEEWERNVAISGVALGLIQLNQIEGREELIGKILPEFYLDKRDLLQNKFETALIQGDMKNLSE